MTTTRNLLIPLAGRALLEVSGPDAQPFLQGLISNDVAKAAANRAIHAALLTPQGKYLHDFFVFALGGSLYVDAEAARLDDLVRRLKLYKLRAEVEIAKVEGRLSVFALTGSRAKEIAGPFDGGVIYPDPRLDALGARAAIPPPSAEKLMRQGFARGGDADYQRLRLELGVPDGSRDLVAEKSLLMENGFEELGGIDFEKGCFVGQEVTARMKHRALVKKRLCPVAIEGTPPAPGTPVLYGTIESGEMRSSADGLGLAMLRIDHVEAAMQGGEAFTAAGTRLTPRKAAWLAH